MQTENKLELEQINRMLILIADSSHPMPEYVFHYYVDFKKKPEEKIFYNLIADSYLTLFSYCNLMFENAWSQAFALLRMGIEQISAIFLLTTIPDALREYLNLHTLKVKYIRIKSDEERKVFLKEHNIKRNRVNDYFDYGWVSKFTSDGTYGRNQMIQLARLDEFLVDIDQTLNAFSHGSLSVFQMSGDNWNVMRKYGKRANLTCCKLYDFLCYSLHGLVGHEVFSAWPLDSSFKEFKQIYKNI